MKTRESRDLAVTIAKDVIKLIKDGRILVSNNEGYISNENFGNYGFAECVNLQTELRKLPPCKVCALGACFVAKVDRFNQCFIPLNPQTSRLYPNKVLGEQLSGAFSYEEMARIEASFECDNCIGMADELDVYDLDHLYDYAKDEEERRVFEEEIEFGRKFENSTERLIAIMENIIANDGEFKPV